MRTETYVVGSVQTNCYMLYGEREIIVIDPAASYRRLAEKIRNAEGYVLKAILLTHGHFDHIGAVDQLVREFHCPVYACIDDREILTDAELNSFFGETATVTSRITWLEGDRLSLGEFDIQILYTPGHTSGSVMYIIDGKLFSGDTLFRFSVGRTDLYSGSYNQLKQSLSVLYTLPADMIVYPGHGEPTVIGDELKYNPYL